MAKEAGRTRPRRHVPRASLQIGHSCGNIGLRFSRCEARPSRASAPVKPRSSSAVEGSKIGPLARSQLFSAYLGQRDTLLRAVGEVFGVFKRIFLKTASPAQKETRPN